MTHSQRLQTLHNMIGLGYTLATIQLIMYPTKKQRKLYPNI